MLYEKITEQRVNAYLFNGFYTGPQAEHVPIFDHVDNLLLDVILAGRITRSGTDLGIAGLDNELVAVPAHHYIVIGMGGVITILTPTQLQNNYRPIHRGQI